MQALLACGADRLLMVGHALPLLILVHHFISFTSKDEDGQTAFELATEAEHPDIAALLAAT